MARGARHTLWFAFVIAALALAGCLTLPNQLAAPPASAVTAAMPVSLEFPGAEPVVAVSGDGTIYAQGIGAVRSANGGTTNVNKVWRSTDDGKTWSDVTPPLAGQERSNDGFVAAGNKGTVYAANVFSLTFEMFSSTNRGESWTPLNVPRIPMLMHRHWILPIGATTVLVSVEALPPSYAPYLAGQAPPSDAPATPNEGMWFFKSENSGQSWSQPTQIDPQVNFAGQSNMVASLDGKDIYVMRFEQKDAPRFVPTYETGHWYLIASRDSGATWKRTEMFDLTSELSSAIPTLILAETGNLTTIWSQAYNGTSKLHYSFSSDGGESWATPRVLPVGSGIQSMVFGAAKRGDEVSLVWYEAAGNGTATQVNATWDVYHANMRHLAGDSPTNVTTMAAKAVHEGNICSKGPACQAGEDRRLLDYPWLDVGDDGRARFVWASTAWDEPSAFMMFASEAVT